MAKTLVLLTLAAIVASLFSALALLFRAKGEKEDPTRVAKALTVRVALSVTLFLLLMAGFYFGLIPRDGL
ncbi:MAG: twin transmembrane helix small protein [Betaproteobacteria bacterium]|nr:twin transmembrane helix small protein [Betaproteobacteria bacterium]